VAALTREGLTVRLGMSTAIFDEAGMDRLVHAFRGCVDELVAADEAG
jgi:hypothetical protein